MQPSSLHVRVGGVALARFGAPGQIVWSTRFADGPCGPEIASCQVAMNDRDDVGQIRLGQTFEVLDRGRKVFGGTVSEVGRGYPRPVYAKGWARRAWDALSSTTPGQRVGRDAYNRTYTPTAATSPTWLLDASDLDIGVADDRLYTRVVATYATGVSGGTVTSTSTVTRDDTVAQALFGVITYQMDLTGLGLISSTTAGNYASQQLAEFAIPEWTSQVSTSADRLRAVTGQPAHLTDVAAGDMVRIFNLPATFGGLRRRTATNVILGGTEFDSATPAQIKLSPTRVAPRNIVDLATKAQEQASA